MNVDLVKRIESSPETLKRLLSLPFPEGFGELDDTFAWEHYQQFLAYSPRRLVEVVSCDYHAPRHDELDDIETYDDYYDDYSKIYDTVVSKVESQFSEATFSENDNTGSYEFDEEFTYFDFFKIAYWIVGDRIALLHFAGQQGDGDFQMSICICVVPLAKKTDE